MGKDNVKKISRQSFLEYSGLAIVGSSLASLPLLQACENPKIAGQIVGANHAIGHLIRKAMSMPISQTISKQVMIVGSGISGLTAGYFLQKHGIRDYITLELEQNIGGNSSFGQDADGRYPWAAHYLPIPNNDNKELIEFLHEKGVITAFDDQSLPIYDEYSLCFQPEERLFVKGYWQEGLVPNIDVSAEEKAQFKDFFEKMNVFKKAKGNDGFWAFDIPVDKSSKDASFAVLDSLTMAEWLNQYNFDAKPLLWYINYCLLDDYGTTISEVSAWAGIHYFASRKGQASNAASNDVLTWPEGNGRLMQMLAQHQLSNIKTQQLVYRIDEVGDKIQVDVYDWKTEKRVVYEVSQLIWAIPQMMRPYILPTHNHEFLSSFSYAPWLVANLKTKPFDTGMGQALAWDNVIFEGKGLGYVVANHQQLKTYDEFWQLTYYKPLYEQKPADARKVAIQKSHQDWVDDVMNDLQKVHPTLAKNIVKIDVKIWGHAMARPTKGFVFGENRSLAKTSINNRIHFAHSDLSGISIFEEAFYWGHRAANQVKNAVVDKMG